MRKAKHDMDMHQKPLEWGRVTRQVGAWCTVLILGVASYAATAAEQITYYHLDALGSPVAATNELGNQVWREDYRPYGDRIRNETAAQSHSRWYTGHPHDNTTGLTYAGARYYDPVVGRFMGVDPVEFAEKDPHSFNLYAYGNNNPYLYVDPNGEFSVHIHFILTFESARSTGASYIDSLRLARDTAMVDLRPGSQSALALDTSQHYMSGIDPVTGNYQSSLEAQTSGDERVFKSIATGDLPGALHGAQDKRARTHEGKMWKPGATLENLKHLINDTFPTENEKMRAKRETTMWIRAYKERNGGKLSGWKVPTHIPEWVK